MTSMLWREIRMNQVASNCAYIQTHISGILMAVCKADAYGHGLVPIGRLLEEIRTPYLVVATWQEGVMLRKGGVTLPCLVLGYTPPKEAATLIQYRLIQTVGSLSYAEALSHAVGEELPVHMECDTGMCRMGFSHEEVGVLEMQHALCLPHLRWEGLFTHFAGADMADDGGMTALQTNRFDRVVEAVSGGRNASLLTHVGGSGMAIRGHCYAGSRVGLLLYGYSPYGAKQGILPALSVYCRVEAVRTLHRGDSVGYGMAYTAQHTCRIATLAIGYADGLPRGQTGGAVLIKDTLCPVVGRVCMDRCMVDVTEVGSVSEGEVATVLGEGVADAVAWATCADTIPYEILTGWGSRVRKVYI